MRCPKCNTRMKFIKKTQPLFPFSNTIFQIHKCPKCKFMTKSISSDDNTQNGFAERRIQ